MQYIIPFDGDFCDFCHDFGDFVGDFSDFHDFGYLSHLVATNYKVCVDQSKSAN